MRNVILIAGAVLAMAPAALAEMQRNDADGRAYLVTVNSHGAEFKSAGGDLFYLGKRCDAFHPAKGQGSWGWANGGFCATFPEGEVCFPRQDAPVKTAGNSDCRF